MSRFSLFCHGDKRIGVNRCNRHNLPAVCVYGAGDLLWLLKQHHLFANKFDPEVDDVAIRCLESVLHLLLEVLQWYWPPWLMTFL
uniref:Uncharacterized protein n=1 Tax=Neolamprologus brichardi TaxID=32507 RepID=A0A3Q4N088_NEOBR